MIQSPRICLSPFALGATYCLCHHPAGAQYGGQGHRRQGHGDQRARPDFVANQGVMWKAGPPRRTSLASAAADAETPFKISKDVKTRDSKDPRTPALRVSELIVIL